MSRFGRGAFVALVLGVGLSACGGVAGPAPEVKSLDAHWRRAGGARAVLAGPLTGTAPKALIVLIPGGGWSGLDPTVAFTDAAPIATAYQRQGFATLALDYRAGAAGVSDVDAFYRRARRRVGPSVPICAVGGSAGGHLALLLATRHHDIACVISLAGPTDLPALARDPRGIGYRTAVSRFGVTHLAEFSPALHARGTKAAVLLVYATNDPYVPVSQGTLMKRALPRARLIILHPGPTQFVHSRVDTAARARATAVEARFLARAARRG